MKAVASATALVMLALLVSVVVAPPASGVDGRGLLALALAVGVVIGHHTTRSNP